jgi:hypothetical protein
MCGFFHQYSMDYMIQDPRYQDDYFGVFNNEISRASNEKPLDREGCISILTL